MSRPDDHFREGLPDDFPDLTIPARRAPKERPDAHGLPSGRQWHVGDRVLAPWEPTFLYAGRVAQIQGNEALIQFDDGDAGWVSLKQLRPMVVPPGQHVLSRRRMGHFFYPGRVTEARGDEVCVEFEDGHEDEWTTVAALRIPCPPAASSTRPTRVSSHLAFLAKLEPGARVWAHWAQGAYFAGTVDQVRNNEAHIHFDDGDRGWVPLEQTAPLEFAVGMRVMGRWKMGPQFYPGVITDFEGDRVHIRYDDGDEEWTLPAALAVGGNAGPNARPT
jgi:hypothetical protein